MKPLLRSISRVALLLLPVAALAAAPTIYRWKDADGVVHFTQAPPPDAKFETVEHAKTPSPAPAAAASGSIDEANRKYLEEIDASDKAKAEAKGKDSKAKAESKQKCEAARQRLVFLDEATPRRLAIPNPDGSYSRMDEDQFLKQKADAQKDVDASCR